MKISYLSIILLSITFNAGIAQVWDINTTWVYETDEWGPPIQGNYLIYKVYSDTIIDGESYYRILLYEQDIETGELKPNFDAELNLKYEDNQVFYYYPYDSTTNLIYDFNLEKGDSYMAFCDFEQNYFLVNIDSTEIINHNGTERKVQYVSSENVTGCYLDGKIIEGMGFHEYILPRYTSVDPPPGGYIVCYNDPFFSYPEGSDCQLIVNVNEQEINHLQIYPNPTKGTVHIEGLKNKPLIIKNTIGQTVYKASAENGVIDISHFKQGLYFLTVQDGKYLRAVKIIKTE